MKHFSPVNNFESSSSWRSNQSLEIYLVREARKLAINLLHITRHPGFAMQMWEGRRLGHNLICQPQIAPVNTPCIFRGIRLLYALPNLRNLQSELLNYDSRLKGTSFLEGYSGPRYGRTSLSSPSTWSIRWNTVSSSLSKAEWYPAHQGATGRRREGEG